MGTISNRRPEHLTEEELLKIEKNRAEKRQSTLSLQEGKEYGLLCPACEKPNNRKQSFCTGCSFQLDAVADLIQLPDNVFQDILLGKTDTEILYRDETYAVFDDKYPVADNHIEIIPTHVIEDISCLTADHIPLIEGMVECALNELRRREDVKKRFDVEKLQESLVLGFNFPVSVKHLHLHAVLPPFNHRKVFVYPRWHSCAKVLQDLKQEGHVTTYVDRPMDEEGKQKYAQVMRLHEKYGGSPADVEDAN